MWDANQRPGLCVGKGLLMYLVQKGEIVKKESQQGEGK